jgi:thiamine pyrophosphate-dependent acetolactate synthase large subunit-like protein
MGEALAQGVPVIHIGGGAPQGESETGPLQGQIDTVKVLSTVTKWSRRIYDTHRIPEYVSMAFRHAYNATPGPVYLECATDVLKTMVEEDDIYYPELYRTFQQWLRSLNPQYHINLGSCGHRNWLSSDEKAR